MNCEWREKSTLYADGELDLAAQQAFTTHLESCPECSSAVLEQQELKKAVRVAGKRFSAPPELYAEIRRAGTLRSGARKWIWGLAAACALAIAAAGATWYLSTRGENAAIAQLVDQHVTMLASANPIDVVSEDRHTVKPWFQGKLPFTFNLPELNNSDFKLLGGKVVYTQHAPGAELVYQLRQHKLSAFIFQARDVHGRASAQNHAFTVRGWQQGGLQYYVVTDAAQEDAERLHSLLQEANR
jgi:anti-sigma factor RsiW